MPAIIGEGEVARLTAGIQKAINSQETPVKEKHARTAVLGTHQEGGCSMFWQVTARLQLQANPIVAWKFCHVLHKMMRDGHPQTLPDCVKHQDELVEMGKMWGHLRDGYGKLIALYTKLLHQKIIFHSRNPKVPGNLLLTEEELITLLESDVNEYFDMCVQIFDFLDDILALQAAVFSSLDMSRANSMTGAGQCRLSPLIQCIQDSCQLYDFAVNILFKLHTALPPDTLGGHRTRFNQMFRQLKDFYHRSRNLQFFKHLVQVPSLPDNPPNFLEAAAQAMYTKPVAVVTEPDPEPEPEPEPEPIFEDLVDTSESIPSQSENGTDEKDRLIEQLMMRIESLQAELERIKSEAREEIFRLRHKVKALEAEVASLRSRAATLEQEKDLLQAEANEAMLAAGAAGKAEDMEKLARSTDEKFKKMKDIYGKLREEHVGLLRKQGELTKDLSSQQHKADEADNQVKVLEEELERARGEQSTLNESLQQSSEEARAQREKSADDRRHGEEDRENLLAQLREVTSDRERLASEVEDQTAQLSDMKKVLEAMGRETRDNEERLKQQARDRAKALLARAATEGAAEIQRARELSENPQYTEVRCSAEYLLARAEAATEALDPLAHALDQFKADLEDVTSSVAGVTSFAHALSDVIGLGVATAHSASQIEKGEELVGDCHASGDASMQVLTAVANGELNPDMGEVRAALARIQKQAEDLLPRIADVKPEEVGDMLDREMASTSKAIEAASQRIQEILRASREQQTGIQLEVNEQILESCTQLMQAIMVLIHKSKELQREIVAQGRGASTSQDYYKKHHRWTEGLISAAKAVGWGANVLMETAEKVIDGKGKFEELVVCSQEIAASTAQLVVASKVKADRSSTALKSVFEASKGVTSATGSVVASAKAGRERNEEKDMMDFSKLTLHAARREEMVAKVRVMELEAALEKERHKLGNLRKVHYQLEEQQQQELQEQIEEMAKQQAEKAGQ